MFLHERAYIPAFESCRISTSTLRVQITQKINVCAHKTSVLCVSVSVCTLSLCVSPGAFGAVQCSLDQYKTKQATAVNTSKS